MSNIRKTKREKKEKHRKEWPAVVYFWILGLGFLGYFIGETAFEFNPHPIHWSVGLAGALIGLPIGWLWYRWRGDVF